MQNPSERTALSIATLSALLALGAAMLTRVGLLFWAASEVPVSLWPGIFLHGLYFDLASLGFVLPLILIYEALLPNRLRH
ncbi:MAG: hypothetical protein CVV15_14010, partial [Gammaproteobacteria bacterium HGW-Gammaproteobacteria-5]